jgi:hypothetical protein
MMLKSGAGEWSRTRLVAGSFQVFVMAASSWQMQLGE